MSGFNPPENRLLQLLILRILDEEDLHGYEIIQRLTEVSNGVFQAKEGSVYTVLRRMDEKNLLQSKWKKEERRKRRVYRLTPRGQEMLEDTLWEIRRRRDNIINPLIDYYEKNIKGRG